MNTQTTLHLLFEAQVEQRPQAIAAIFEDQSLTYLELNQRANQLAHYLQKSGIQSESKIAIAMERSLELLVTILAILKVGAAYVPLDSSHPEERLLFILADNDNPFLLLNNTSKNKFISYSGQLVDLDNEQNEISKEALTNLNLNISTDQLAYIIYTSGSTGKPKGVLIEHKSIVNYCLWFADFCSCKSGQRIDFSANYIFDMSVSTSITPLTLGLTVAICSDEIKRNARPYLRYLKENKINLIKATPSYLKVLLHELKNAKLSLPHLQTVILGGENLATAECRAWLALYPKHKIFNEYGPTEATVAVSSYQVKYSNLKQLGTNVPIGKIGPNFTAYILSPQETLVADGEIGELYVGGQCLARGYLNQPELTKKKFIKDPFSKELNARLYKTGDLCRRLPDGVIEYFGRIDFQVKIRGFRIEPTEIEKEMTTHPAIAETAVLVREDHLEEKRLIAYYILKDSFFELSINQIRAHLKTRVPYYMIPSAFVSVTHFPLTANGKLDPTGLPIPEYNVNQHYLAPRSVMEKRLSTIWSDELGIKPIGIEDDFFELGGHSLSAARIISKINKLFAKEIRLADFYQATTIKQLASAVERAKHKEVKNNLNQKISFEDNVPLPLNGFQFLLWISNTFEPQLKKLNVVARKRFKGKLKSDTLAFAFNALCKKHEILFYRISKFRPAQVLQKNVVFRLEKKNITHLSDTEALLTQSFNALKYSHWPKNEPLLKAQLFHINDEYSELQISMPHIISDDETPSIIFSDLSRYYHEYEERRLDIAQINPNKKYRDYVVKEQQRLELEIDHDLRFWKEYLSDAHLFLFPQDTVVQTMDYYNGVYSSYIEIPEEIIEAFQRHCAKSRVSINDGLSAAISLILFNYSDKTPQTFMLNIVQSTRDDSSYDDTVGCFLQLHPLKVKINAGATFEQLAKQIHQSTIDTSDYQASSSFVKIVASKAFDQPKNRLRNYIVRAFLAVYATLIRQPKLNRKVLNLCERLARFKGDNQFLININVHGNFLPGNKRKNNTSLFSLAEEKIKEQQSDLLQADHTFDVCFFRDKADNKPFVVISANLKPSFRELFGKELIRLIKLKCYDNNEEISK